MSDFITIENLYERCDVLIDANTNQSYYIQMYDEPVLESDNDLIIYQFADEQDFVEITDEGYVIICEHTYTAYNYQCVSKERLINE